jgi:hypothetical protein
MGSAYNQTLYSLTATYTADGSSDSIVASRYVGFRVFYLVTGNDTLPSSLAGKDGSGNFTMRFKVRLRSIESE